MEKFPPFYYKLVNNKLKKSQVLTYFICIYKKKIILEMFISTLTEYFTVKSGQEVALAPVIAVNFMCLKFFLYFCCLSWGSDSWNLPLVTPASIVLPRATNKVKNLNVFRIMLIPTDIGSLSSKFEILCHPIFLTSV